eukprot:4135343-Prymnesium_polylepis.1
MVGRWVADHSMIASPLLVPLLSLGPIARSYTTETAEETLQTIFQCDQDGVARSSRSCTAAGAAREP